MIGAFVLQIGDDSEASAESKLIRVPQRGHHQDHLVDLTDLPDNFLEELGAFFEAYRMLEPGRVRVLHRRSRADAVRSPTG